MKQYNLYQSIRPKSSDSIGLKQSGSSGLQRNWCDVMWCDVMWCDVMWCDVMWCDVMWCDVMWCDVMWCDVMWCDVMWCDVFAGVRRSQVPPDVGVPQWLPLCTPNGQVYHTLLSPQCWPARQHLSGHPQGEVVSSLRCPHNPSVHTKSSRRCVSCPVTYDLYNSIHISYPSDIRSV